MRQVKDLGFFSQLCAPKNLAFPLGLCLSPFSLLFYLVLTLVCLEYTSLWQELPLVICIIPRTIYWEIKIWYNSHLTEAEKG